MSKQLVKMAATARPTLMAAAQEQLVALRAELATLPPAAVLGDGHAEMLHLIDDVSANIHVSAGINRALAWRCVKHSKPSTAHNHRLHAQGRTAGPQQHGLHCTVDVF